jgi:mannose-6-phosphate isomerase
MGAHPGDPSHVGDSSLLEIVDTDPIGQLGADCASQWGNRLPFLLKILAADEALSLQAHPSAAQAREGYEREESLGIPRDAKNRNYPDPTAKPELVCALTEFHALAGFRDPYRTVRLLRELETPGMKPYTELLAGQPDSDGLRALFTTWITLPQTALDLVLPEMLDACVLHVKNHGEFNLECRTILELGEAHGGDAGVLAALLLNRVSLAPGEAIFLPAGNLHTYLRGTAVEILANSDNILRGGLTPKHVDVPELLRVLDFTCADMPVLRGTPVAEGHFSYPTDALEFELSRLEWAPEESHEVHLSSPGPQIMICTAGGVVLESDGKKVELGRGESAWLAACDPDARVTPVPGARAQVFRATAGG